MSGSTAAAVVSDKAREKLAEAVLWFAGVALIRFAVAAALVAAAYLPMAIWVFGIVPLKCAIVVSFAAVAVIVASTTGVVLELLFDAAKDHAEPWARDAVAHVEKELRHRAKTALEAASSTPVAEDALGTPVVLAGWPSMLTRWRDTAKAVVAGRR